MIKEKNCCPILCPLLMKFYPKKCSDLSGFWNQFSLSYAERSLSLPKCDWLKPGSRIREDDNTYKDVNLVCNCPVPSQHGRLTLNTFLSPTHWSNRPPASSTIFLTMASPNPVLAGSCLGIKGLKYLVNLIRFYTIPYHESSTQQIFLHQLESHPPAQTTLPVSSQAFIALSMIFPKIRSI